MGGYSVVNGIFLLMMGVLAIVGARLSTRATARLPLIVAYIVGMTFVGPSGLWGLMSSAMNIAMIGLVPLWWIAGLLSGVVQSLLAIMFLVGTIGLTRAPPKPRLRGLQVLVGVLAMLYAPAHVALMWLGTLRT